MAINWCSRRFHFPQSFTCLSHSFSLFCWLLFSFCYYIVSVWLSANTFYNHFLFFGKFFSDGGCWIHLYLYIIYIYYTVYTCIHQHRFLREEMEESKKTASSTSLTCELFGSKDSSSSSGIFGSIFAPSTKVLFLILSVPTLVVLS